MRTMAKIAWTLNRTIKDFESEGGTEYGEAELCLFRDMPNLKEAIRNAANSKMQDGTPYAQQVKNWNFWPEGVRTATRRLVNACDEFSKQNDFDGIHELTKKLIRDIHGVRRLYDYDVSFKIGAFFRDEFLPKKVYLHAGTRDGAKRLGLDVSKGYLEMDELPPQLPSNEIIS